MRLFIDSLTALLLTGVLLGVLFLHRKRHRLFINSLIALMLTALLASLVVHHHGNKVKNRQYLTVQTALETLHDKATFIGALEVDSVGQEGFPMKISPVWFREEGLPMNVTIPGWHPWLDVAPLGDHANQPPDPIAVHPDQAGFWYNPNNGVFRARVTPQFTEKATLDLYNELNNTNLTSLPQTTDAPRQPRSLFPSPASSVADSALTNADRSRRPHDRRAPYFGVDPRTKR